MIKEKRKTWHLWVLNISLFCLFFRNKLSPLSEQNLTYRHFNVLQTNLWRWNIEILKRERNLDNFNGRYSDVVKRFISNKKTYLSPLSITEQSFEEIKRLLLKAPIVLNWIRIIFFKRMNIENFGDNGRRSYFRFRSRNYLKCLNASFRNIFQTSIKAVACKEYSPEFYF